MFRLINLKVRDKAKKFLRESLCKAFIMWLHYHFTVTLRIKKFQQNIKRDRLAQNQTSKEILKNLSSL